tara:strand:- start:700 stop:2943 length:2244 start_codon:yes stop_codon:yes gene_type:complete
MKKIIRKFIKEQIKTLHEAEVKGDVVNLHYKIDVYASPSDGDMSSVIDYVENNEVVNKYGIKVEVGALESGPQEDESSVYVKFSLDRSKRGGTMTAIRLLRDVVIEFIEKKIGAVAVDIEAKDFKPDGPSDDEYDQMAQQSAMDDRRQQGMDPGLEEAARELGYLDEIGNFHDPRMSSGNFDRLTAPNPKDQIFKKKFIGNGMYDIFKNGKKVKTIKGEGEANTWINNAKRELDEAVINEFDKFENIDFDVKSINMVYTESGRFYGFNTYSEPGLKGKRVKLSYIEEVNKFLQSKGINIEIPQRYDEAILDSDGNFVEYIVDSIVAALKEKPHEIEAQHNDYMDVDESRESNEAYTSEWDPETAAKNLRVAKGIEPKYTTYTKGEKVTYLGHPAVITGVKEYNGKIYYSVSYDKGNGKTKASSILSTDGTIKSLEEAKSKEDQLKIARAAFEKAEMNGDIRGQELALAALDLIKNRPMKGLSKPSGLKEMASELGYLNEDEQLSKLLQLSKHADVRDGEEKISKLAAAWDRWNYDNGDKYDDLVTHLFMAAELLGDGYRKDAQMRLRMFNKEVVKVMGGLSEEKKNINEEKSSLFSQTLVDDIEKKIREITGILEDGYNENVGYQEYKFEDGTGGFAFKWTHAGNWGGRLNLSLNENGNHTIETLSYYDDRVFNAKTKFKSVQTWKDLSDDDLFNIFRILQPSLKKNEMLAKKALSDEASAQSDYYANKPDTGRIGYGLSQQPRKRN